MYWYLSFLRPPPVSVSKGTKTITITPQVANDLRTEYALLFLKYSILISEFGRSLRRFTTPGNIFQLDNHEL